MLLNLIEKSCINMLQASEWETNSDFHTSTWLIGFSFLGQPLVQTHLSLLSSLDPLRFGQQSQDHCWGLLSANPNPNPNGSCLNPAGETDSCLTPILKREFNKLKPRHPWKQNFHLLERKQLRKCILIAIGRHAFWEPIGSLPT